jgi:hypothetical protein
VIIIFPQRDDSVGNGNSLFYNCGLISVCVCKRAEIVAALFTPNWGRGGKYFRFLDSFVQSQKSFISFSRVYPSVRAYVDAYKTRNPLDRFPQNLILEAFILKNNLLMKYKFD